MTDRAASQAHVDRSTVWVAVASVVVGVLDAVSTILCLLIGITTAEFGLATLAIALFPIVDLLGGIGLVPAAVREPDTDPDALSSMFWVGTLASAALLVLLLLARTIVGSVFADPIVLTLLAAYAARLVIRHLSVVPEAMMKRDLRYRELSIVRVVASLAETIAKLGFAYLATHGFRELAVWCFVLGPIVGGLVTTVGTLICYPWRPRFAFRREVVVRAARFTASISGGELLFFAYTSADYLVIGSYFGAAAVGVYRLAYELVLDVVRMVSRVTSEVAFPAFVRVAADRAIVGAQLLRFTRQNLIALAPFLVYVAIEADDLLALVYSVDSPAAATAARILCLVGALRTLSFLLPIMLAAVGGARRVLIYQAIAAVVLPLAFVIGAELAPGDGYVSVAWAWAAGYPIAFAALVVMALPWTELRVSTYVRAIAGVIGCAAGACVVGVAVRVVLPDSSVVRAAAVAPIVLAAYAVLLARIEHVTLGGVVRSLRAKDA